MRLFACAIIICLSFSGPTATAKKASMMDWMIEIKTPLASGGEMRGTGYIVKIGKEFFVRTASHVTLGTENVRLQSIGGKVLSIIPNAGVIDNFNDDQLIRIQDTDIAPLGFYSKQINNFVVHGNIHDQLSKSSLARKVETGSWPSFYLTPPWNKKKHGRHSSGIKFFEGRGFNLDARSLQNGMDGSTLNSSISILPGDSGSPLFSTTSAHGWVYDLEGNSINQELRNSSGYVAVILGHAQNYLRFFSQGSFSTPLQAKNIVERYLTSSIQKDLPTVWNIKNGVTYRKLQDGKDIYVEANFTQGLASDATGGNGSGDGTSGNGSGDGTSGNGGDGDLNARVSGLGPGMILNGKSFVAFEITGGRRQGIRLYANWDNLRLLLKLREADPASQFAPILNKSISALISDKIRKRMENRSSEPSYEVNARCKIERGSLYDGILYLHINGYSPLKVDLNNPHAFLVHQLTNKETKEKMNVDLYGLFSIDLSEINAKRETFEQEDPVTYYSETPFVVFGSHKRQEEKITCTAFSELLPYQKP